MAGEFSEHFESMAYSPALSNPQFKDLWNMSDIQALNQRERRQFAQLPTDFHSPSATVIIARDAGGFTSLPDASDLLQSLKAAENLSVGSVHG
jgi:hypothetical protein